MRKNGVRRLQTGESQREIYRERDGRGDSGGDSAKGNEGERHRTGKKYRDKKKQRKKKLKLNSREMMEYKTKIKKFTYHDNLFFVKAWYWLEPFTQKRG